MPIGGRSRLSGTRPAARRRRRRARPRAHEVDPWGGHARRQQKPVARLHCEPKLRPGRSGRGSGSASAPRSRDRGPITIRSPPWHGTEDGNPDLTRLTCQFDSTQQGGNPPAVDAILPDRRRERSRVCQSRSSGATRPTPHVQSLEGGPVGSTTWNNRTGGYPVPEAGSCRPSSVSSSSVRRRSALKITFRCSTPTGARRSRQWKAFLHRGPGG